MVIFIFVIIDMRLYISLWRKLLLRIEGCVWRYQSYMTEVWNQSCVGGWRSQLYNEGMWSN